MTEVTETEAREEEEAEVDLNAINAVDSAILRETATRLAEEAQGQSATVATKEATWQETALRVTERLTWNVTNAMKSVILQRSAKVINV